MRTAFVEALCEVAAADERVFLLTADLGFSVLEVFERRFPSRYLNVGVAEQNMTGVAAGLAMAGKVVFTYSIANFPTLRCLEQIRNDVCYHNLPVKVVSVGGGLAYGAQGYTHHGVEDMAVMRALPRMTVVAPGDPAEARAATAAIAASPGPCYLRLGKAGEPKVHASMPAFELGKAIPMSTGTVTLISTGGMLETTVAAAEKLRSEGVSVGVLSMPTIMPLDDDAVMQAARRGPILTVEEHGPGGLGTAVAEVLAVAGLGTKFRPLRLPREAMTYVGSQVTLRSRQGLSVDGICDAVRRLA